MHIRDRQFIMVTARNMRNKDNTHFSLTRSRDTRGVYRLSQSNAELEGGRRHPSMASIVLSDLYLVDGFNARQPRLMATSEVATVSPRRLLCSFLRLLGRRNAADLAGAVATHRDHRT
jgi:hypothetical protein